MDNRLADLEARLAAVERRLSAVEGKPKAVPQGDEKFAAGLNEGSVSNAATHLGRVLLIFGGAYFLRAITDYKFVNTGLGIFLGASYAVLWLVMAYRVGGKENQRASALFFSIASLLLALPLLVEAVTRFDLLSGTQGSVALAIYCVMSLLVAAKRDLRLLAWAINAGGVGTAMYLISASLTAEPYVLVLLLLALATLWTIYSLQWRGVQWISALGANTGVIALVLLSTSERWSVQPMAAFAFAVVLLLMYMVSFGLRTHVQNKEVGIFEVVQGISALGLLVFVVGEVSKTGQINLAGLGFLALLLGALVYALAFTPRTLADRGRNFFFYSTLGLGLVAAGSTLLLAPAMAAAAWAVLALVLAWYSGRQGMVALSLQCSMLLIAAGLGSGILSTGFQALAGSATESWPNMVPWEVVVALATVVSLFIPVAQRSTRWGKLAGLPQVLVLVLAVWEVGGLFVLYLAPVLAAVPSPEASLAILAALRTTVLSIFAVSLAFASRHKRWPEAKWLVYPVLIMVGAKLLVEDFPNGQPATLFVSLAAVGIALITVSRVTNLVQGAPSTPRRPASKPNAFARAAQEQALRDKVSNPVEAEPSGAPDA
ncbi:MAG: hypothetical protein MUP90_00910 [Gammaproteobacteria bacterium]|nr:hypothetical protein [Gammaproteobacteria bacterium]